MKTISAKRLGALLLALVLCVALALPVFAEEPVVYTGDAFAASRTRAEIGLRYAAALAAGPGYSDGDSATWYSVPASVEAPYAAGTLTADTHTAMTAMTDYYRWLVGVAPLKTPSVGSDALQKGALVRNFEFNHSISDASKPADMDQDLWDEGAAVWHNILAKGYTPRGAINGYLNEGYDRKQGTWDTIGHRMALLSGNVSELQYGYADHIQIGLIAARTNTMQQPFAAFPAAGDMPLSDISARYSAWSVELNSAVLRPENGVVVTVTNTQTGESYECTTENGLLHVGQTISFAQPVPAAGADAYRYADGETYRVRITGLTDAASGGSAEIDYTVRFFDVRDYTPTTVTSCAPEHYSKLYITKKMNNPDTLSMLAQALPKNVEVKTEVGRTLTLPVAGAWQVDVQNGCFTNAADSSALPGEVTDPDGLLSAVTIPWEQISYTGRLSAQGANGQPDVDGSFTLTRYNISCRHAELYQQKRPADGRAEVVMRFDNTSGNFSVSGNDYLFAMTPWQTSDSGTWFGIYYSDSSYWSEAYAVGTVALNFCAHEQTHIETTPATCTQTGATRTICDTCGALVSEESIPALGHDWDAGTVTKKATCTEEGEKTFTCKHDPSHTRTEEIPALGHDFEAVVTAPTCTEAGCTTHTCPRCGSAYTDSYVNALGHDWGEWEVVKEPTRDEPGLKQRVCKNDPSHIETEEIPATDVCDGGENCPSRKFVDVDHSPDCWYHAPVDWAVLNGITAGINADHFDPDGKCTRSQAVTFLWRAMNQPEPTSTDNPFSDVSESDWYYKPVLWAVENNITLGVGGGRFDPDGTCNRSQIVTFLWRALGKPDPTSTDNPFSDVSAESWYYQPVLWAVENGITAGVGGGRFDPDGTCIRSQIVTFLYRCMK